MDKDLKLGMAAYQSMYAHPEEVEQLQEESLREDLGTTIKYIAGGGAKGAEERRNRDLATAKRLGDIRAGRTPVGGLRSGDLSTVQSALRNSVDMFDIIKGHLLDEGYADTEQAALVIMANMSEEWRQEILEAFVDPEHGEAPSGRSPLQNVSDHPKASVRKKAVKGFKKQMGKEYGGKWKSRTDDPTG